MYHLTIQSGKHKGATWPVGEGSTRLGRGRDCDVVIGGDRAISRVHCEILVDGDRVEVTNLSERSLTMLNGNMLKTSPIRPGDLLVVGTTTLVFSRDHERSGGEISDAALITRTLSHEDAVYLGGRSSAEALQVKVEAVADLAELFHLGNALSEAATVAELLRILGEALLERFQPGAAWIARPAASADAPVLEALFNNGESPRAGDLEGIAQVLATNEGALHQHADRDGVFARSLIAVPMTVCGEAIAALALISAQGAPYQEGDVQFLLALGRAAGPCLAVLEQNARLRNEVQQLRARQPGAAEMLGVSAAFTRVRDQLRHAAASSLNVLILGESGTGKELAARMIHAGSPISNGPYIVVNCAAIPNEMLESELFGHEKGAFTGASTQRKGLVEQAHGGTLFLDEIGDLSEANQARLLRVLEDGSFRRLGGNKLIRSTFRTVAATNKDIPELVAAGKFREDLYHRINGFEFFLPPLRERPEDIVLLANHFLKNSPRLSERPLEDLDDDALAWLVDQPWTGNARQLRNVIERAIVMATGKTLTLDDLRVTHGGSSRTDPVAVTIEEAERQHIASVVKHCQGDVKKAATILGVSRSTLYSKMKRFDISP